MKLQKLIILYRVIMKHQKYKEDSITGWANQCDTNYDAIMLNNILMRKTTATALPQISYTRNKTELQHQYFNKSKHLQMVRGRFNHKSNDVLLKMTRQKTQECYYQVQQKLPLNDQNKQFCNNQLKHISNDTPHQINIIEKICNNKRNCQHVQDSINIRGTLQSDRNQQRSLIFSKTTKARPNNAKSQDPIHLAVDLVEQKKKSQPRLFVNLNKLQMTNKQKHFRYDCIQKINQNHSKIEQQHQNVIQKRKKRNQYKIRVNSIDKIHKKLKTTFTKKDSFNKNRRKVSRSDNIQFSDQVIFQNNSIEVSKQIMTSPFLYQKIQIMKQLTKYPLVFK